LRIFLISLFGIVGVLARYSIQMVARPWCVSFPFSTLAINIVGSFLIGIVFSYGSPLNDSLRVAIMTGLLGGFTTFSAFSLDALLLFKSGSLALAFTYIFSSVLLSMGGTLLGMKLAGSL
jgi:CrcB protein